MSYYCAHINKTEQKAWEALTQTKDGSGFHQSFAWASFKQTQDWETYKIGVFSSKGILVGGCIVLEFSFSNGTNFLYVPEGPVLDYADEDALFWQWRALETALHSIASLTPTMKTTHIRIEPRLHTVPDWFLTGFIKAPINLQPRHTQMLDLSIPTEQLLNDMKQKGRYNIRLAEKKGVTVTEVPIDQVHTFYPLYKKTFTRNKFEGKDVNFFHSLTETCRSISKLFIAQAEGKNLASAIIVYYGSRATYLYGASTEQLRSYMAPYALHWHIAQDAKKRGYTEYDFWGIAPDEHDIEHDWHGLTKFKKQFGGTQETFIGSYDYVLQHDLYEQFVRKYERT